MKQRSQDVLTGLALGIMILSAIMFETLMWRHLLPGTLTELELQLAREAFTRAQFTFLFLVSLGGIITGFVLVMYVFLKQRRTK